MKLLKAQPPLELFYKALAVTLFSRVIEDLYCGTWYVHTGQYYAWRHPSAAIPLLPAWAEALQWLAFTVAGLGLFLNIWRRASVWLALVTMLVSLTQMFQNQKILALLVLLFLSISVPDAALSSSERKAHPVLWLLRCQLLIVYLFSALNKVFSGFTDGTTLSNTFHQILLMPHGSLAPRWLIETLALAPVASALSIVVLVLELGLPVVLIRRPQLGVFGVTALHLGFALLMPGIWPFTFVMIALSLLFL